MQILAYLHTVYKNSEVNEQSEYDVLYVSFTLFLYDRSDDDDEIIGQSYVHILFLFSISFLSFMIMYVACLLLLMHILPTPLFMMPISVSLSLLPFILIDVLSLTGTFLIIWKDTLESYLYPNFSRDPKLTFKTPPQFTPQILSEELLPVSTCFYSWSLEYGECYCWFTLWHRHWWFCWHIDIPLSGRWMRVLLHSSSSIFTCSYEWIHLYSPPSPWWWLVRWSPGDWSVFSDLVIFITNNILLVYHSITFIIVERSFGSSLLIQRSQSVQVAYILFFSFELPMFLDWSCTTCHSVRLVKDISILLTSLRCSRIAHTSRIPTLLSRYFQCILPSL